MPNCEIVRYVTMSSKIGPILIAQSIKGIVAVLLNDRPAAMVAELQTIFPTARLKEGTMGAIAAKILQGIEDPRGTIHVPLDIRGTDFEKKVWNTLRCIPVGTASSYSQIARAINRPNAARAVGSACGKNVLAVLIPCHRAVRSDGKISGYRWGTDLKRVLLSMEAA